MSDKKRVCLILGSGATCGSGYKIEANDGYEFYKKVNLIEPPTDQSFFDIIKIDTNKYPALHLLCKRFPNLATMEQVWVFIELAYLSRNDCMFNKLPVNKREQLIRFLTAKVKTRSDFPESEFASLVERLNTEYINCEKRALFNKCCEEHIAYTFSGDATREYRHLMWNVYRRFMSPDPKNDNMKQLFNYFYNHKIDFDVVTFNYDLLCERNLNDYIYINENGIDGSLGGRHKLIKLHGSLNWLEKKKNGYESPVLMMEDVVDEPNYNGKAGWSYSQPAMVVPTFTKAEITDDLNNNIRDIIRAQWVYAKATLAASDTWIFIGYSFPGTDSHAKDMLFNQITESKSRTIKFVIKINKCCEKRKFIQHIRKMDCFKYLKANAFYSKGFCDFIEGLEQGKISIN